MATVPVVSTNFADLLDPRFTSIFFKEFDQIADMVPTLFDFPPDNGRDVFSYSEVGAFGDWTAFEGSVNYDTITQGFDVTATHKEFASGFQVDRKLFDDDQFHIMDERPAGLADAAMRTRQKHASRILNNAFSVDSFFYVHSEAVALCSDSHTTNAAGVSTATGFDNVITTAFSATALVAARNQFIGFRDDRGNRAEFTPDELWYPVDIFDKVFEVLQAQGKPGVATNDPNVFQGALEPHEWIYMSDSNNWFLGNGTQRKRNLKWVDRINMEFAQAEDIDTLIAKWRGYMRYAFLYRGWRWLLGASVS